MLPMSFKFRVNSYIKSVISKTRENSRLKTRHLKGIMIEQLFIISNARAYLDHIIYLALKNRKLNTLFILISKFLKSHLTILI
jgi:hypothetical protein